MGPVAKVGQKMFGQQHDVVAAFDQRRQLERDDVQPEIEILAKSLLRGPSRPDSDSWRRSPGRRCGSASIRPRGPGPFLPARAAVWPGRRDSGRRSRRETACRRRPARTCPGRVSWASVKAPFSWPNSSLSASVSVIAAQLTAINGCSRRRLQIMDRLGDDFLAGAVFAQDQDGQVGVGHAADGRPQGLDRRAFGRSVAPLRPPASAIWRLVDNSCWRSWAFSRATAAWVASSARAARRRSVKSPASLLISSKAPNNSPERPRSGTQTSVRV